MTITPRERAKREKQEQGRAVEAFFDAVNGFRTTKPGNTNSAKFCHVVTAAVRADLISKGALLKTYGIDHDLAKAEKSTGVDNAKREQFISDMETIASGLTLDIK